MNSSIKSSATDHEIEDEGNASITIESDTETNDSRVKFSANKQSAFTNQSFNEHEEGNSSVDIESDSDVSYDNDNIKGGSTLMSSIPNLSTISPSLKLTLSERTHQREESLSKVYDENGNPKSPTEKAQRSSIGNSDVLASPISLSSTPNGLDLETPTASKFSLDYTDDTNIPSIDKHDKDPSLNEITSTISSTNQKPSLVLTSSDSTTTNITSINSKLVSDEEDDNDDDEDGEDFFSLPNNSVQSILLSQNSGPQKRSISPKKQLQPQQLPSLNKASNDSIQSNFMLGERDRAASPFNPGLMTIGKDDNKTGMYHIQF